MRLRWKALSFAVLLVAALAGFAYLFLANDPEPDRTSETLAGSLHDAVKDGDIALLRDLIAAGEDLEAQDRLVGTALHWAALTDNGEAAEVLIAAGADVNTHARGDETTAFHIAAQRGSIEVAAMLIEAGVEMEARDNFGLTPLLHAAENDQVGMVALLLDAGADINARGIQTGLRPLHRAARRNASGVIELLAGAGVDIDEKLQSGLTPLYLAVSYAATDAVRTLLELGADVNGRPDVDPVFPTTPLERAITRGMDEIADILRAAGATE